MQGGGLPQQKSCGKDTPHDLSEICTASVENLSEKVAAAHSGSIETLGTGCGRGTGSVFAAPYW
jgi:hypothetical protein